jgi:hypothetical protein
MTYQPSQWPLTPNQASGAPFASTAAWESAQKADTNLLHQTVVSMGLVTFGGGTVSPGVDENKNAQSDEAV